VARLSAFWLVKAASLLKGRAWGAHALARRAIQISSQVFRYAVCHGLAEHNPGGDV